MTNDDVPLDESRRSFPIVGIGASAGGLQPICELIAELGPNPGIAVLVVQHLDPSKPSLLPEILARFTSLTVVEATDGAAVQVDQLYVIPPGTTMTLAARRIRLRPRHKSMGMPMPVDDLLDSLAKDQKSNAVGVILSGSGTDGAIGMQAIHEEGGITFVQDEATAAFGSMPRAAVMLGGVDLVLPPAKIGAEIMRIATHPHSAFFRLEMTEDASETSDQILRQVFALLSAACNIDFSHYKVGTVNRRLSRRMALRRLTSIADYLNLLRNDHPEVLALGRDLLVQVTEFFRDPESFDALVQRVLPGLIDKLSTEESVRIWVPGCASGEEVYSIAICVFEYLCDNGLSTPVRIFGTDVSEEALETARTGRYFTNISRKVSTERLERFFIRDGDHYVIEKYVRDVCTFARHNVAVDPPFSKMDLISCRNLLIYLDPVLQQKVMPLFHYALRPNGALMLGPSETVGTFARLFAVIESKRTKLYSKRPVPSEVTVGRASPRPIVVRTGATTRKAEQTLLTQSQQIHIAAEKIALARYAPAFVVCDDELNIVEFRGDLTSFLVNPDGPPSASLRRLARPQLLLGIGEAVGESRQTGNSSSRTINRFSDSNQRSTVCIEVHPMQKPEINGRWFLIFFNETRMPLPATMRVSGTLRKVAGAATGKFVKRFGNPDQRGRDAEIDLLRSELESARMQLRSMIEQHESAQEELKSSEEELLSSNEEFQSTNEELETAKEELQSINEELSTTNDELRYRNHELKMLQGQTKDERDYADSIVQTMSQPMLILDDELRVVRANDAFLSTFLVSIDVTIGDKIYTLGNGQWRSTQLRMLLEDVLPEQTTVRNFQVEHDFPELGHRIMLVNATRISAGQRTLILVAIDDVTEQRYALEQLKFADSQKNEFLAMLAHELRNPLAAIRNGLHILGRDDVGQDAKEKARLTAQRQLVHEIDLVDDLLDISRITHGAITLTVKEIDFTNVVLLAVDALRAEAGLRHQELTIETQAAEMLIRGDPLRIEQIVTNILGNALKYTDPGGRISVSVERQDEFAKLVISDNGIGISPAFMPDIFTMFKQSVQSDGRQAAGLGLGLALVRRLVELHHGTIEVRSGGLGEGSTFIVLLPTFNAQKTQQSDNDLTVFNPAEIRARRVLVVDDNRDALESTQLCLELDGHEVAIAIDGASAIETAVIFKPEIAFIDIGLPDIDGYEVARRIKKLPQTANAVLVALTGYGQEENIKKSREAGFLHHVVKPADIAHLEHLIGTLIVD
jgi:two-component system CheB/CheR fusion protein